MKKIWMMMAMTAIFAGCSNEETEAPLNVYSLTGYADAESRTAFGTPNADKIPFVWSANDYIYAGNTQSNVISTGGNSATFTFSSTPSETDVYYNMTTGSTATEANVLTSQNVGDLGSNGDFGYGTISDNSFTLNHATAYVWFNVTGLPDDATLENITLDAGDAVIAGTATWDGNKFGDISNGSNTIQLAVGKPTINGAETAMVVFPTTIESASVTYQLKIGETTKFYKQTLGKKELAAGHTYKVSINLANVDLYELRVLTFEDGTQKFSAYTITGYDGNDYYDHSVTKWSDLIDTPEYGGPLAYGDMGYSGEGRGCDYNWYDNNNTFLASEFPVNYYSKVYWGGGHVISNYASEDYTTYGTYNNQQTVYGEGQEYGVTKTGGRNGSSNFAMHFGYKDSSPYNMTENLPYIYFKDNTPRIIDHMYVNNSAYAISCYMDGNGLTAKIGEEDWVKVIATGYGINNNVTGTAEIYLCNGPDNIVTEWTKWDLTSLGMVYKVEFNITGSSDNGYGFSQPAYFAYDDVAVQFTE